MPLILQDELLTADELAQFLKLNRRTVYRMLEAGELPFALKVKGSWRFKLSDVEIWLENQKVNQGAIPFGIKQGNGEHDPL